MNKTFAELHPIVIDEIGAVLAQIDNSAFDQFCLSIAQARRIVCFGLGREGLALRGLAMRLMHLGLDAHVAGDVTAQPVTTGDILIVTSGPGSLSLTKAMVQLGKQNGATVIVISAQAHAPDPQSADLAVIIPAQTMVNDQGSSSVLAMGTAFEAAMTLYFDIAVIRIQELTGQSLDEMRARHFNLE